MISSGICRLRRKLIPPSNFDTLCSYHSMLSARFNDEGRTILNKKFYGTSVPHDASQWHGTTIICVRKNNKVVMMSDGQVSQGNMTVKGNAKKVRRIGKDKNILVGFAGSTADAFTLIDQLEKKLEENSSQLMKSCVDLAKDWRTNKFLRRLEAALLVADSQVSYELTGYGDVLDFQYNCMGIGSGGPYALSAARALMDIESLSAEEVAKRSMKIASELCVFTNDCYTIETIDTNGDGDGKIANQEDNSNFQI